MDQIDQPLLQERSQHEPGDPGYSENEDEEEEYLSWGQSPPRRSQGRSLVSRVMSSLKQTEPIKPPPGTDPLQQRVGDTTYLYLLTAFVSLGAFLFGYDQGVMGVIVADKRWIDLMQPANSCAYLLSCYLV